MLLISSVLSFAADHPGFVVRGTVSHDQFGTYPTQQNFRFVARSAGCQWTISLLEEPKRLFDEVLAVGNSNGVFITMDITSAVREKRARGELKGINMAQSVTLTNTVPVMVLAPHVGPIWLTYLSACYLKNADPARMPPPIALNIAGGSPLPMFARYYQKSIWSTDAATGLPNEFVSLDDEGYQKGIVTDQLVRLQRFSPPFDKGFTNVVFKVSEHENFSGYSLPKKSHTTAWRS